MHGSRRLGARVGALVLGLVLGAAGMAAIGEAQTGTGFLEICKEADGPSVPGTFSFTVSGKPDPVTAPMGGCTGIIQLPAGEVVVTEAVHADFVLTDVRTSPVDRLVSKSPGDRQARVKIVPGDESTQTAVFFKNKSTAQGRIQICKAAASAGVAGTFRFTVDKLTGFADVGVGQCSPAFAIDPGTARVTEKPRAGLALHAVSTDPAERNKGYSAAQGIADVEIVPGSTTKVTFHNEAVQGRLKICKIAGSGVAENTQFTYFVSGGGISGWQTVDAGPASQGGNCGFGTWFPVGTPVTITETLPQGVSVESIAVAPASRIQGAPDLAAGKVTVVIGEGVTEAIFTNRSGNGTTTTTTSTTTTTTSTTTTTTSTTTTTTTVPTARVHLEKFTRLDAPKKANLCDTFGKPARLTMRYLGGADVSHNQDPSKVSVTGNPAGASPVRIVASEKEGGGGKVYFDGNVSLNGTFVIDAGLAGDSELRSETFVTIFSPTGTVLQRIKFHTSCSQPMRLGDRYGVELVGFADKNGNGDTQPPPDPTNIGQDADVPTGPVGAPGDTVIWTYLVTNPGGLRLSNVRVTDDAGTPSSAGDDFTASPILGPGNANVGDANANGLLDPGEEWRFTARGTAVLGQYANLGRVVATPVNQAGSPTGPDISDDDPSHYLTRFTANICDTFGKPARLTMRYLGGADVSHNQDPSKVSVTGNPAGASPVRIVASEKEGGGGKVYFDGNVSLNGTFVIDAGLAGDSELRSETFVTIFSPTGTVLQRIKFHTSCSQPMHIGDRYGVELVGFVDKDGKTV